VRWPVLSERRPRYEAAGRAVPFVFGTYAVVAFVCALFDIGPSGLRSSLAAGVLIAVNSATAALAFRNAASPRLPDNVRRAWRLLGVASCALVLGHLLWSWQAVIVRQPQISPWFEVPFLAHYPLVLLGILSLPPALGSSDERLRFSLDAATVVVAGAMCIWYFVLYPTSPAGPEPAASAVSLLYSLGDLVLLLAIASIWLRRGGSSIALLTAGLVVNFLTNIAYAWQVRAGSFHSGGVLHAFWVAATALVAASADRQYHDGAADMIASQLFRPLRASIVPYVALASGYGLLLFVAVRDQVQPLAGLVGGALALTAIVVARQIAAVRDNLRLLAERSAQESEARFRALVQHSSDIITILDADTTIRFASPAVAAVVGHSPETLAGRRLIDLIHPDDREKAFRLFRGTARADEGAASAEWRLRHRESGEWVFTENIVTNLLDEPTVSGMVLNTRDVSERRRLEEQLTWQAFHDPLTRLPNRSLFLDRVSHALTRAARTGDSIAVLFVDLDNFKLVNDSHGHAEGDRVLVAAGERLTACVRAEDTVARLGGDEFALLIEDAKDWAGIDEVAQRVVAMLGAPFEVKGRETRVGASVGIDRSRPGMTPAELLRNADVAMYVAKARGKGDFQSFQPEMHAAVSGRLESEADLRRAVDAQEFQLYYQPILRLADRVVVGFEALLRWAHPVRGIVTPDAFIPLAEETGLIVPLGRWAIRDACRRWRVWRDEGWSPELKVSINVSARHFQDPSLVTDVGIAMAEFGLPPAALVLEITESVLMQQTEATREKLYELKALGLQLAVDDFGTGYSSLGYLHRFPIDVLKIDKTFVEQREDDAGPPAIARAIIGLAEALRLQAVAEGIEEEEQARTLIALGCQFGQGHLFARARPPDELGPFLARALRAATTGA
jgi:diguanylate cyclase (GGDEF)-like protein/PAS domain S-box-containing protein